MTTYLIEPDFDYLELDLDPLDLEEYFPESFDLEKILNFSRHNVSLKKLWPQIEAGFTDGGGLRKIPDISIWLDGALLLSAKSMQQLSGLLEPHGEILPIQVNNEEWFIFNCLDLLMGMNQEREGEKTVYKQSEHNTFGLFCNNEFKNRVEKHGLRGVTFDKTKEGAVAKALH